MFRKLKAFLTAKAGETFGFRLAGELDDYGKEIMAVFDVSDFYRDYEDTWEWVEGDGANGLHVNVSRPHNRTSGDYDIPVVVRVSGPMSKLTNDLCCNCAQSLANRLQTEVWIGSVLRNAKSEIDYDFDIEQRFRPVAQ